MKRLLLPLPVFLALSIGCTAEPVEETAGQEASIVPEALIRPALQSDPRVEAAILTASPDYTREMVEVGGGRQARYLYARADLNDDGVGEVIVYLLGSFFCGTGGCNLLILTESGDGYRVVNNFPTSDLPLVATRERSHGWNDLVRKVSGGGMPTEYVHHTFDGERYIEKERLSAETAPHGEAYLADEFTFEDGLVLEPHD